MTASTGNHGAATAWAADRLGLPAVVYAPEVATQAKLALVEGLGAEIRLVGADLDEAKEAARGHAADVGLPFFEDGAEALQYEGYGAIAGEILDQLDDAAGGGRRTGRKRRPPRRHRHAPVRASTGHDADRSRGEGGSCDG